MILFQNDKINFHLVEGNMTDPVSRVSGTKETSSGGTYSGRRPPEERKKRTAMAQEGDLVEISKGARATLSGRKRKSILEYLKALFGWH